MLTGGARNLPSRQQTLRKTISWSYNLLSPVEQAWLRRLSVFTGGWSLEAAAEMMQGIAASRGDTAASSSSVEILEQLVDNSLLVWLPVAGGQARFAMLETLREYALEQLAAQGERERLQDWLACYYLRESETAEIGLRGPQQLAWLANLTADRENLLAALEWSLQRARVRIRISDCLISVQELSAKNKRIAGSRTLSLKGYSRAGLLACEVCLRLSSALMHLSD